MKSEQPLGSRRPARWNFVALLAPLVGFPFGVWAAIALSPHHFPNARAGLLVWCGFCVFGLYAAAFAILRAERWLGVTTFAILVNVVLTLFTAWAAWED